VRIQATQATALEVKAYVSKDTLICEGDDPDDHRENPGVFIVPPESTLSPIYELLVVDLLSIDEKVIEEALKQLADLCDVTNPNYSENWTTVHRAGGAPTIVGAMRRWYNIPCIQVQGCRALATAAASEVEAQQARFKLALRKAQLTGVEAQQARLNWH
jgi:hypothetical protein